MRSDLMDGAYLGVVKPANFVRWWVSEMFVVRAEIDHRHLPIAETQDRPGPSAFKDVLALCPAEWRQASICVLKSYRSITKPVREGNLVPRARKGIDLRQFAVAGATSRLQELMPVQHRRPVLE